MWQSPDPILNEYMSGQTNGGVFNPRNLSLFTYTYNNPVNLVDPDGNNPGPVYIKGPLAQIDLQSGNSIVDNTVLGAVNTIFNFSNSLVNSGLNALTAIDNAVSPYEGAMYSAAMGGVPQTRPAAAAGYVGIKATQAGGKLSSAIHTLSRGSKSLPIPKDLSKTIHMGQQGKHIEGHNNYRQGRSTLLNGIDPQKLLDSVHNGSSKIVGESARGNPIVDFGKSIGIDARTGKESQFGQIHFGKNGAHIVPENPIKGK